MPAFIRDYDNHNHPIIEAGMSIVPRTYFNLVRLNKGQTYAACLEGFESVYVVLSGQADITVNGQRFASVGQRNDIWSGKADSVYAPADAHVAVAAVQDATEIAVAGGQCDTHYQPFRVTPEEVEMVEVGSSETHSRRRIFHILGHNAIGRAGNLLVSELYADGGCWSGYPPHKHDQDRTNSDGGVEETGFEEVYHYRFNPPTGFGAQLIFQPDGTEECYRTRNGDTILIDKGFHPTVTSPGHAEYIFTILVGRTQRSLVQYFKEEHRHLMSQIPGIAAMREKFK